MRFLILSFLFIFYFLILFSSLFFSGVLFYSGGVAGRGRVQRWRADEKGQGMNGIKIYDVKNI